MSGFAKSPRSAAAVQLGIDIGGTKTQLRFRDLDGASRDLVIPTAEWRVRDWDKDAAVLMRTVHDFVGNRPIASMAVGANGCDDASECEAFERAVRRHAAFPVQIVNDAELLPAAMGLTGQIGLVAGTGSIAVCRTAETGMLVAGGWGWIIGDEGSAAGLVREAAREVNLELDRGGSLDEPLTRLLLEALEIKSAARIGSAVARHGGAASLGRHATIIFEAERLGSAIAAKVIDDGGKHLTDLVERLKARGSRATTVVAGGGVIVAQPRLARAFRAALAERFDGEISAEIYVDPPVEGACRLAAVLAGEAVATGSQTAAALSN